jgi:hypothetical protein
MKLFKTLLLAATAILFATPAFAQTTTVRITGSTAFRSAVNQAIFDLFQAAQGGTLTNYGWNGAGTPAPQLGESRSVWRGTISGVTGTVIIKTSFQGSVGGVQTLDQNSTRSDWGADTWNGASNSTTDGQTVTADVALSDSFQTSTIYTSGPGSPLTDKVIGVVGFVWAKCGAANALTSWNNMTALNARSFLGGKQSLQLWTGNTADAGKFVIAMGRDGDSGTRLEAFATSGFGILSNPLQYETNYTAASDGISRIFVVAGGGGYTSAPTVNLTGLGSPGSGATATAIINAAGQVTGFNVTASGSGYTFATTLTIPAANITGGGGSGASGRAIRGTYIAPYPQTQLLGDFQAVGRSGYASGGTLAGQVNNAASTSTTAYGSTGNVDATIPVGSAYPCTYVSKGDNNSINSGRNALASDGVFYVGDGTGTNNTEHANVIQNGQYSFWGFEHLMYRSSIVGTATETVAINIANRVKNFTDTLSGLSLTGMNVSRATDAAPITVGAPSFP